MVQRSTTTPVAAITALVLVVALLVGGGFTVRTLITRAFDNTTVLRNALGLSRQSLTLQLDEETGVRGFEATHDRAYLEPFDRAQGVLPQRLTQLEHELAAYGIDDALASAGDAQRINGDWISKVALPVTSASLPETNIAAVEVLGKSLIDRYRADIETINTAVTDRMSTVEGVLRSAIDRINLLIGSAAVVIAAIGALLLEFQRRTALRIERERLRAEREQREADALRAAYNAEKRIADSLQEAIAQRPLPTLPTLVFSATYVPATEETKVGGDWYDALELPHNRVLFAIGDVTGHGIEAAVTMNRARQALISSALLEGDPAAVLRRVNDEMYRQNAPLVTAVAGFADAGTYEFVYSTAGHPPPLLIEPGRRPRLLECGSLPLGAIAGSDYVLHRIQSVPGAILVLYTDGAVEHSRDVIEGEELLIAAAAGAAEAGANDPASFIHKTIFAGRAVGDDVAILTIGFADDASTGLRISADDAQSAFTGRLGRTLPASLTPLSRTQPRVTRLARRAS
jgi:serine phosphatase RsbU (regulator of sigma subunit)